MMLLGGHDEQVATWAGERMGIPFVGPLTAHGVVDDEGQLRGAAIWNDFQGAGGNIELTYLGKGTLSRSIIRGLVNYAFTICGASRVTAKTSKRTGAEKLLRKFGFKYEATRKRYWSTAKGGDAIEFVLFRDDAKQWMI